MDYLNVFGLPEVVRKYMGKMLSSLLRILALVVHRDLISILCRRNDLNKVIKART